MQASAHYVGRNDWCLFEDASRSKKQSMPQIKGDPLETV